MSAQEIIDNASKLKIAIIGDLIWDRYITGEVTRISPEAPVPVVRQADIKVSLGGAGNVWMNLLNLGVDAHLFCFASSVSEIVIMDRQETEKIHVAEGPMSKKTRIMSGNHHLLRIDEELKPEQIVWPLFNDMTWHQDFIDMLPSIDAVIISDYGKGVVSKSVGEMVVAHCNDARIPVIVDSKAWFERFGGADILKMNHHEHHHMEKAYQLYGTSSAMSFFGIDKMVVTRGDKGIDWWYRKDKDLVMESVCGIEVPICDACGAGDTVTAILAMMYAMKAPFGYCCEVANQAAAEVCKYPGVYAITKDDFNNAVK